MQGSSICQTPTERTEVNAVQPEFSGKNMEIQVQVVFCPIFCLL